MRNLNDWMYRRDVIQSRDHLHHKKIFTDTDIVSLVIMRITLCTFAGVLHILTGFDLTIFAVAFSGVQNVLRANFD
jgi:hypothetical protein